MTTTDPMAGKASFDDIYDRPDPRAYARELSALEYQIPEHAREVFSHLVDVVRTRRDDEPTVADLCCSYGINAALLNHDVTLDELYAHYTDPAAQGLSSEELIAQDQRFYAERRRADAVPVVGVDAATSAVEYGVDAGILVAGRSENLEEHPPSAALQDDLADVGLVTVTGGIGYITETTFDRLLDAVPADEPPWVAAFTLRWVDMAPIAATLDEHDLVLERLEGHTFRQRRFADDEEAAYALEELRRLGIDPEGVETDGYHHTFLYVGRPRAEAAATDLDDLLAPVL